jgi:amidase
MVPLNIGALEGMKAFGIDLMGEHRRDFPSDYLQRVDAGRKLSALHLEADQAIRSEVYDAIQSALACHEILVCPTLAAMPVDDGFDCGTKGPAEVDGLEVDPVIGWCLTYVTNLNGHPSASVPATVCRLACRSSDGVTPTAMCWRLRRLSNGCVLGAMPTRFTLSAGLRR